MLRSVQGSDIIEKSTVTSWLLLLYCLVCLTTLSQLQILFCVEIIMNDEWEIIQKEAARVGFRVLSQHLTTGEHTNSPISPKVLLRQCHKSLVTFWRHEPPSHILTSVVIGDWPDFCSFIYALYYSCNPLLSAHLTFSVSLFSSHPVRLFPFFFFLPLLPTLLFSFIICFFPPNFFSFFHLPLFLVSCLFVFLLFFSFLLSFVCVFITYYIHLYFKHFSLEWNIAFSH
jgi:hypothetical protein